MRRLTRTKGFERITHVVWPETALPYRLQTRHAAVAVKGDNRRLLRAAIPERGTLITGANQHDAGADTWNSIHVVDRSGTPVGTYDKHHLVPFGEYVPGRAFLGRIGVTKIVHGRRDYAFGPGPRSIAVPGAPDASPLICYEAIFPAEAVGATRPGWLLNLTNDAWFGDSAGPHQHFAAARLRTIEQGLPMVRAANTGISAVVDPYGRVTALLPLGRPRRARRGPAQGPPADPLRALRRSRLPAPAAGGRCNRPLRAGAPDGRAASRHSGGYPTVGF